MHFLRVLDISNAAYFSLVGDSFCKNFKFIKYKAGKASMEIMIKVTTEQSILLLKKELDICMLSSALISRKVAQKYASKNMIKTSIYIPTNTRQESVNLIFFFELSPIK